jgi:hypothetical protein
VEDRIGTRREDDSATGLRRGSVSRAGVFGQSLAIRPSFSAGFLSGTVAVFAGFNTPLSTAGVVALAYVLTLYARRFAGAAAVYGYLARGVHSSVGSSGPVPTWLA